MQSKKFFEKVVPPDQGFGDDYGGVFHFRFWVYGEWVDIVIDDYLPVDTYGNFVFVKNIQEPNEMWAALLEKAFAKYSVLFIYLIIFINRLFKATWIL